MNEWIDYYDSTHTIYVSDRHRAVHFRAIADHIVGHIPFPNAVVLDYSCGEALCADRVAAGCRHLILAEPAPGVRTRLHARFDDNPKISIRALSDINALGDRSIDLVAMVSVAQYMSADQLDEALKLFRRVLTQGGHLALGDVIAPDTGPLTDAAALLRLALRERFLPAALVGLVRTALSDYRNLRARAGFTRYSEAQMLAKLAAAGFSARRAAQNMGHNAARMTFVATPKP